MATESGPLVLVDQFDDHITVITINRPERRNAFDGATARAMEEAIDAFDADDTARVAIIRGARAAFSAGQDLKAAVSGDFGRTDRRGGFGLMAKRPSKPLIAAVEGHALAGGFELCLACDLVIASTDATMGIPEAAKALVAVGGGLFRLPKRIPYHIAMELALTGEPRPASFFAQWGLVNYVVEPDNVFATALSLARRVAASGPLAVRASTEIVRRAFDWTEDEAWTQQHTYAAPAINSHDTQEGIAAFLEKRQPAWKGR
ncbi:crotonase/enoyl-CoA hydratase family protein [Gordonia sp. HY285]|uniref:crotonase/enoyl-CoA hydratase family protein n=1 Tax=Gordonia liuliyuniae TaxID=2911517 RepID=UPI001F009308|nr:crotonase/enoyl-CoA hydratase family protein [Gordonia liuliyuniae]MCF8608933.1 crotonase/enoyl-CoA hydratase family protein [Gordonia liuliyuniae]